MKNLIKEYAVKIWPNDKKMSDWLQNQIVEVLKIKNIFVGINKPKIEKTFCFHDEGPNFDLFLSLKNDNNKMKNFFLLKNTKELQEIVQTLDKENCMQRSWVLGLFIEENGTAQLRWADYGRITDCGVILDGLKKHEKNPDFLPVACLSTEERECIKSAYKKVLADFEKRLAVWWKKYGAEKLNTFTYWADR